VCRKNKKSKILQREKEYFFLPQGKIDASVKNTWPSQFWRVGVVFAAFFGFLTFASR